jgi:hypothetical protein
MFYLSIFQKMKAKVFSLKSNNYDYNNCDMQV